MTQRAIATTTPAVPPHVLEQLVRVSHVPDGPATAAMMLIRFATLWWAVLVGFGALGLLRLRYPDKLGDASAL